MNERLALLPADPAAIVPRLPGPHPRVLLIGAMGTGKSTLAAGIALELGDSVFGIGADPGSPAFGVPGAVNLGRWRQGGWRCLESVPLCTLDAARFRLPLVQAVGRLAERITETAALVVDAPGVVRGVAGSELLQSLVTAAGIEMLVVLENDELQGLAADISAIGCLVLRVAPSPLARRPARHERDRHRTGLWDAHLRSAVRYELPLDSVRIVGTAPPVSAREAWRGRQASVMSASGSFMGEVVALEDATLVLDLPATPGDPAVVLVRDAGRNDRGQLVTVPHVVPSAEVPQGAAEAVDHEGREPLTATVGRVEVQLVNGVFGDPLVALKLANVKARLLFDLGDAAAMPVKVLHQVEDVFVSHGHIDHIGGFLRLLRARLSGHLPPCRIFGPAGIIGHVTGFVAGVRWDRIGDGGPAFHVGEIDGERLRWSLIQPGRDPEDLGSEALTGGVLLRRDGFRVRHVCLDHGIPVLAFALELDDTLQVREEALHHHRLAPGPWLAKLKHEVGRGNGAARLELPGGRIESAGDLGDRLLRAQRGTRIAYATDLADSPGNRRSLRKLANEADLFICEATFLPGDGDQARATKHLTLPGCVEIALEARARQLLPFHFSRRYGSRTDELRDALERACRGTPLAGKLVGPARVVRR